EVGNRLWSLEKPLRISLVNVVSHTSWRRKKAASRLTRHGTCYRVARVYAPTLGRLAPAPAKNCCCFACAMAFGWSCGAPTTVLGQCCLARLVPSSYGCSLQAFALCFVHSNFITLDP
ncbi:hypothetical protein HAX54_007485, partial [Datura stramonium]|nr:hypothetical protein [Datura stramonium]